jgi:NhaP-type Na+/H+ or K+/H+ antiporter
MIPSVDWELAIVALALLAVAAVSKRLEGTPVTPAMAFVAVGILFGPKLAGGVDASPSGLGVKTLAEATLTVVLFTDAARINVRELSREFTLPMRLLGIGLPLTIVCGALVAAVLFPRITLAEAFVLAIVLAPTDAALGQAVVSEPTLPLRIRQGLNVESGLNDGICVPLLLIFLAIADVELTSVSVHGALTVVAKAIGYGVGAGLAAGALAAAIVTVCRRRGLIAEPWLQVVPVAAAALAYGTADPLHGSGFIAAFVAGMTFGALAGPTAGESARFSEEVGDLLGGVTFLVFGAVLLVPAVTDLSWAVAGYAVLSLTVIRMLPVAIAMLGSGARWPTIGLLGWFGPRGLASIVFAVIVVSEAHLQGTGVIVQTTYVTIGLSVLAHGASAAPLARRYARWYASHPSTRRPPMESGPAQAHRVRGRRGAVPRAGAASGP